MLKRKVMNIFAKYRILSGLLLLLPLMLSAQQFRAVEPLQFKLSLDTNKMLIGEQTQLHLQAEFRKGSVLQWPQIGDTITADIEVVRKSAIDTIASNKVDFIILNQDITITAFDSGYFVIPPMHLLYNSAGSALDSTAMIAESNALLLEVKGIPVDLKKEFKDIKPILEEPIRFSEILPWLLAALGLIVLVLLIIYIYSRYKQNKPLLPIPQAPKEPAHIIALRKLNALSDKKLWQTGAVKEFYSELTDIMREYMEHSMHFGAMEMVSDDIISNLEQKGLPEDLMQSTQEVLQTADLVKFAKMKPLADENDRALKWGFDFVEHTRPREEKNVEPEKTKEL
jgi:hypothetical protein